jgi:hypothetical protein
VRQPDRDVSLLGEILDVPFAIWPQEQRLRGDAGLPGEPRSRRRSRRVTSFLQVPLEMEQQACELDVGVAATVDDRDAVALEDLPRFGGRVARNEEQTVLRSGLRLLDELPGGRRVGVALDFDRDGLGGAGEPDDGIASPAATTRPERLDADAGDVTKDPQRLPAEGSFYL